MPESDDVIDGEDEIIIQSVGGHDEPTPEVLTLRDLLPYLVAQSPNSCVSDRVQFASEQAQIAVCEAIARSCRRLFPETHDAE